MTSRQPNLVLLRLALLSPSLLAPILPYNQTGLFIHHLLEENLLNRSLKDKSYLDVVVVKDTFNKFKENV